MSEEKALKILNQIEHFDDLCECVFKKEHTCIGCREKALKIILKNYKKLKQENKQLIKKEFVNNMSAIIKDNLNFPYVISLEQKINKAIEYIKENDLYVYIPDNDLNMDYEELANDKLLEILGDKENENNR